METNNLFSFMLSKTIQRKQKSDKKVIKNMGLKWERAIGYSTQNPMLNKVRLGKSCWGELSLFGLFILLWTISTVSLLMIHVKGLTKTD